MTIFFCFFQLNVLGGAPFTPPVEKYTDTIAFDIRGKGRVFEGIGAVSAGASSRLLIDYPEPHRSDILDYLFKPNFGAGFTYLKTEIGGDGNTTCGSEPSFARTREEMSNPNFNRGYEYWLMKEAARRNPGVELDALEWCMPKWFSGIWSEDNASYLLKFIEGARKWGLNMKYIGGAWNEREYDRDWIVNTLRPMLNRNGFQGIKINAPEGAGAGWAICDQLIQDTAFKNALGAVSYHYPDSYMWKNVESKAGPNAINCGLPLWSGEDFSLSGKPWKNAHYLAKNILKCYLGQKIVRVNMWCPIASMPDNACYSNTGIMKGTTPWSGYYEVWPAIWSVAHFNQFAQPGWQYIDEGCGTLPGDGIYGTYKKPGNNEDFSMVIVNGSQAQAHTFKISGFSGRKVYLWKSDSVNQMVKMADITVQNGFFRISLDPESIYSITTTTGQQKGTHTIPKDFTFRVNYADNFDRYSLDQAPLSPRFFYDNSGSFEITAAGDGNKYLRQMVNRDITHWIPDSLAFTFVAQGREWEDGEISSRVMVEEDAFDGVGYAGVILRGSYDRTGQANIPHGYRLNIYHNGTWKLLTKTGMLAKGNTSKGPWHTLRLVCKGKRILAFIDGKKVADQQDSTYTLGAAGYNSGWNHSRFDDLLLKYVPVKGELVSEWRMISSSTDNTGQMATNAIDGNSYTKWKGSKSDGDNWLQIDLGQSHKIARSEIFFESPTAAHRYQITYSADGLHWYSFADRSNNVSPQIPAATDMKRASARYMRFTFDDQKDKNPVGIYEIKIYSE